MGEKHARVGSLWGMSAIAEGVVVGIEGGFFTSSDTIFLGGGGG